MEQFKFPFKEKEDFEKVAGKVFKGRMPTLEEEEELTKQEGGKLTSEQKIKEAKEKAYQELEKKGIIEKRKSDKEK